MKLRHALAAAVGMLVTLLAAAPALAAGVLDTSLVPADEPASVALDRPIVVVGEPSRPCAAPAFAEPIDEVDQGVLADTGVRWGLQVIALAALATAALLAPRRMWPAAVEAPDPPGPRAGHE